MGREAFSSDMTVYKLCCFLEGAQISNIWMFETSSKNSVQLYASPDCCNLVTAQKVIFSILNLIKL